MEQIRISSKTFSDFDETGINDNKLLRELLCDQNYEMLRNAMKKDKPFITITNALGNTYRISKSLLVRSYDYLLLDEDTSDKEFDRILSLRDITNIDSFIAKYKNKVFYLNIDNFDYKVKVNDIIECLLMKPIDFKLFLTGQKKMSISIGCFLYAVKLFMDSFNIEEKYVLPVDVLDRINSISSSYHVDIEALNQLRSTDDCLLKDINIDEIFKEEILSSIPKNMNQLEKAIYLYILLCKTFTYDPIYFAYDQTGEKTLFHKTINYIPNINKKNNKVVCYEFNSIYGYFLNELGIHYENSYNNKDDYGRHASLSFRVGKYIVSADAVSSILSGDLVNSKIDYRLDGLLCLNNNTKTVDEFTQTKERIQEMFKPKTKEPFLRSLRSTLNLSKQTGLEKVSTLVDTVNEKKLPPIDSFGCINKLKRQIFFQDELDKLSYVVVRYNGDEKLPLRAIISYKDKDEFKHFIYCPGEKIKEIDSELLSDMFILNHFEYLYREKLRVPGVHDSFFELEDAVERIDLLGDFGKMLTKSSNH